MARYIDHYQGVRKQDRTTPPKFFAELNAKHSFTLDGAATAENALLPRFSTVENPISWHGERVFCNPPWSNIPPFLEFGPLAEFACFLVPARVNARWFHRALDLGGRPEFFKPKLKFDGLKDNSPTDCLLIVWAASPEPPTGEKNGPLLP